MASLEPASFIRALCQHGGEGPSGCRCRCGRGRVMQMHRHRHVFYACATSGDPGLAFSVRMLYQSTPASPLTTRPITWRSAHAASGGQRRASVSQIEETSSGTLRLLFPGGPGIYWQQRQPFASTPDLELSCRGSRVPRWPRGQVVGRSSAPSPAVRTPGPWRAAASRGVALAAHPRPPGTLHVRAAGGPHALPAAGLGCQQLFGGGPADAN